MKLPSRFDGLTMCLRNVMVAICAATAAGCQTQAIVLSPTMHARVVDATTGKPIDGVRVTLRSPDTPVMATAYSDRAGFVVMPGLLGPDDPVRRVLNDTPQSAVHAIFEHPGYQTYTIDSMNGYGFFKDYTDVHLYPGF
jgi:hypothetical protein